MYLFPAIDIFEGKAVRLLNGDYGKMTVYSDDPLKTAKAFEDAGCHCIHLVDLEGAKYGTTPNLKLIEKIASNTSLFCEIGGGIRSMETVKSYLGSGIDRVILGTSAIADSEFLNSAAKAYGERIAVGADIRDGKISIRGWTEDSDCTLYEFCDKMQSKGIGTLICTDISRDGAMRGVNTELYKELNQKYRLNITASGGVTDINDITALKEAGLYAAIIGKAYYTGAIDLREALEAADDNKTHNTVS